MGKKRKKYRRDERKECLFQHGKKRQLKPRSRGRKFSNLPPAWMGEVADEENRMVLA